MWGAAKNVAYNINAPVAKILHAGTSQRGGVGESLTYTNVDSL